MKEIPYLDKVTFIKCQVYCDVTIFILSIEQKNGNKAFSTRRSLDKAEVDIWRCYKTLYRYNTHQPYPHYEILYWFLKKCGSNLCINNYD